MADVIVADISRLNPNVLYELGIAHSLSKPAIVLSQDLAKHKKLPFDITHIATVPYVMPRNTGDTSARNLMRSIEKYFIATKRHHNPVSIALSAERLSLANYFGYPFLWGFQKTLTESKKAKDAWIVSSKLYWERLNSMFAKKILEERILSGKRMELVLLPNTEENRYCRDTLIDKFQTRRANIENTLRILLCDDKEIFAFLPSEISIYDPGSPKLRAILLEPMAQEGSDYINDAAIAASIGNTNKREAQLARLKESTFDLELPKHISESLSVSFKSAWNSICHKQEKKSWLIGN